MISDRDILQAAQALIRQHGPAAGEAARFKARERATDNDAEGAAIWRLIEQAVEELLQMTPGPDDKLM